MIVNKVDYSTIIKNRKINSQILDKLVQPTLKEAKHRNLDFSLNYILPIMF